MSGSELLAALGPVVEVLERLAVGYSVVGSIASSAHGLARATLDVDVVADLHMTQVDAVVDALIEGYYVDRDAVLDAIRRRGMFNAIHLATMLKVDIYVLTGRPFDRESFARRRPLSLGDPARSFQVDTPEDTVLHKLEWYRAGGEVSERQWGDAVGVLRVQAGALDLDYMRRWAAELGVDDLLERGLAAAATS
jgi:hypothetical protein